MSEEIDPAVFKANEEQRAEMHREAATEAAHRRNELVLVEGGLKSEMMRVLERAERESGKSIEQLMADADREIAEIDAENAKRRPSPERRALLQARVGKRHIRNVADRPPIECAALKHVRAFVDDDALWCLVLSGGNGTRKTGSACWALTRIPGVFIEAHELLDIVFAKKPQYEGLHERLLSSKLVVFDDLGTERADDGAHWAHEFQFMWNRLYEDDAKLILTCNMPPVDEKDSTGKVVRKGFASLYDKRVLDRFREGGRWVNVEGESVRTAIHREAALKGTKAAAIAPVLVLDVQRGKIEIVGALALAPRAEQLLVDEIASAHERKTKQLLQAMTIAASIGRRRQKGAAKTDAGR